MADDDFRKDVIEQKIKKVVEENPVVNRNDVTIMGTSNGAAMIYRLLLETEQDRPFHRSNFHFLPTTSN